MREHLEAFARHLAGHRSPRTAKTYVAILASFTAHLEAAAHAVGPPCRSDIEAFLVRPRRDGGRRSVAARNQELAALRAFAKFAQLNLGWKEDPAHGIPFLREPARDPAVLTVFEVRRLFTIAAEKRAPADRARDLAVLALLSQAGLRVHELVALDIDQLDLTSATMVAVHGKGGTQNDVPLNGPTVSLLEAWLCERENLAVAGERALFVASRGTRISIRSVQRFVERLRLAVGTKKKVTPHTLRHTTATLAMTMGADLSTVAELLRHTDLNTTRRYVHLIDERRREAVRRLGTAIPEGLVPSRPEVPSPTATTSRQKPLDAQYDLDAMGEAA
jgi:integrase/recombinase XerC